MSSGVDEGVVLLCEGDDIVLDLGESRFYVYVGAGGVIKKLREKTT